MTSLDIDHDFTDPTPLEQAFLEVMADIERQVMLEGLSVEWAAHTSQESVFRLSDGSVVTFKPALL